MRRYRSLKNKKPINRVSDGARDARSSDRALYTAVHARSGNRCEVVLGGVRCPRPRMIGLHHVTKRSQGGGKRTMADAAMDLCKIHHDLADNAAPEQRTLVDGVWVRGRLRVVSLGAGKFRCWMQTTPKNAVFNDKHVKPEPDELQRITMRAVAAPRLRAMGCESPTLTGDAPTERSEAL